MTLFRFRNPIESTKMENGEIVDDILSLEWIDRYREAGQFTVTALAQSGITKKLPIGSYVGRIGSKGIMMVEDYQFTEGEPEVIISITGRSFEAFLENRIVGSDQTFPSNDGPFKYQYLEGSGLSTWQQAVTTIKNHVIAGDIEHQPKDAIPYLDVKYYVTGLPKTIEAREYARKNLYSATTEVLEIDNCGLMIIRPGCSVVRGGTTYGHASKTTIFIHRGVDRRNQITFAFDSGEIESADYLFSNKKLKNCAIVTGKWVELLVDTSAEGDDRRMMWVDASDIDEIHEIAPTGPAYAWIGVAMVARGKEALAKQKNIALTSVNFAKGPNPKVYGRDYDVGDIVTVRGGFQESRVMRVTEYMHVEDESGITDFPTLSDVETENE